MLPTQAPTAAANSSSSSNSRGGRRPHTSAASAAAAAEEEDAAAAAAADDRLLGKQLADASLTQARNALSACHVVVLLLDAPRLLTLQQVRVAGAKSGGLESATRGPRERGVQGLPGHVPGHVRAS
jgi:septal ring-binding cell division protein DamX